MVLLGLLIPACREIEEAPLLDRSASVDVAAVVAGGYLLRSEPWGEFVWVRADEDGLVQVRTRVDGEVQAYQALSDGTVLLLTHGPNLLVRLDPSAGVLNEVPLDSAYDALVISDDELLAVTHFSAVAAGGADDIFFTPTGMMVHDLADGADAVTVQLTGGRPRAVSFTPPFRVPGVDRELRMLMVTAERELTLVDWQAPNPLDRQRRVFLAAPDSGARLNVSGILFTGSDDAVDPDVPRFFVRTAESSDLFVIDLVASETGSERELQPSINQIALGIRPQVLERFVVDGRQKLFAMSSSQASLTIVDVQTNGTTRVNLPRAMSGALLWPTLEHAGERWEALLFANGFDRLFFLDLERAESEGEAALRSVSATAPVSGLRFADEAPHQRALALFSNGGGVSVVDLSRRVAVPFQSSRTLSSVALEGDTLFAAVEGRGAVEALNLGTLGRAGLDSGRVVRRLLVAPGSTHLLIVHAGQGGRFSLVDTARFEADHMIRLDGLVLEGVLDNAGRQP
ncbi:MAG: hypothetical protein EA398_05670 [Deltaproteobacteria bacterium]|nr:MAG: hypothetical protein EA398_05670 [Deltaproteobacteria bacterium]